MAKKSPPKPDPRNYPTSESYEKVLRERQGELPPAKVERRTSPVFFEHIQLEVLDATGLDLGKLRKFTTGCRATRKDNLRMSMIKAYEAFVKEHKRKPTAFELYDWIPDGGTILEKDPDTQTIHWKKSKNKETSTTFKSFQHRYTRLKALLTSK